MMEPTPSGILQGIKTAWTILEKLGEGDAGEVYLVASVLEQRQAILKRPRRSVFSNDVRRQAEQIRQEGRILAALPGLIAGLSGIRVPELIDQSRPGSEFSERFFIVISRADGFDLSWLARACRLGVESSASSNLPPTDAAFIHGLVELGHLPRRVILAALSSLLALFDTIHLAHPAQLSAEVQGLIWNDVKPDHIFWNPHLSEITLIDWGNSRLLEASGATRDLRSTRNDDLRQFVEEMGRFLEQNDPDLFAHLDWPSAQLMPPDLSAAIASLRERIAAGLRDENLAAAEARREEETLVQPGSYPEEAIERLAAVHRRLISLGEMPDMPAALRLASGSVGNLAAAADLNAVEKLCSWAAGLPDAPAAQWQLLARLAAAAAKEQGGARERLSEAVRFAAAADWESCLWAMLRYLQSSSEPEYWNDLLAPVRVMAGGEKATGVRPLLTLRRAALTLQSAANALEDRLVRDGASPQDAQRLQDWTSLLETLRETAHNWVQLDPLPPHSGLAYLDVEALLQPIEDALPGAGTNLREALSPARDLSAQVLEAWNRREFSSASRLLRRLLTWDPDRRRLLRADQALQSAPDWLHRVCSGPLQNQGLLAAVTDLEFEGRELRNHLGPAAWLEAILEALKSIRQGTWPGDLLASQPALLRDLPWLQAYERSDVIRRILQPHLSPVPLPMISGAREERYGEEEALQILEPADAWIPEARGSSARAYHCYYQTAGGDTRPAVLKLMRTDKSDYALPLFHEEIQVLDAMRGVPGVNPYLECGFLWLGSDPLPPDHEIGKLRALRGEALRIGPDASAEFLDQLESRARDGWTPYLLLEKRRREDNLLLMCDASLNRGNLRRPAELLRIAIQICDILDAAHRRNVVYRDHKILHYYWQPEDNGVYVIDWNVARLHPQGVSDLEIHMDLVQLGARGLYHLLTGRTAPGALPIGPTRPEEIEQAAQSYRAQWTYDDQRLGDEVRVILEQLLSGAYTNAQDLRTDLKRACMNLE